MNAPNASGWRPELGAGGGSSIGPTASGDRGLMLEEPLIFELGGIGKCGVDFDEAGCDVLPALTRHLRKAPLALPGLAEPEAVRHYTRLSRQNYAIDLGPFPLGSCTMKHNPRLNEKVARLPGFADIHPLQPHGTVRGAYEAMAGYRVENIPATADGRVDLMALKSRLGPDIAGVMITNPNTCGLFERDMKAISDAVHAAGGYVYCDGANFNAIVGKVRPGDLGIDAMHINLHKTFSTPHGGGGPGSGPVVLSAALAPFGPLPFVSRQSDGSVRLIEEEGAGADHPLNFGRMAAFHGQMGMFTRALTYILSHGADGLRQVAEDAVLNANYVLRSLDDVLEAPFGASGPCMHEALFSDDGFADGFTTLDLAKGLIDEGYHPMTVYFPLVVHGAMLVEPTETESKAGLDRFIASLRSLAERARAGDADLKNAPALAPRRRLDETQAARRPVLVWRGDQPSG